MNLPRCPRTDLIRLECGCPDHNEWAYNEEDLTTEEIDYLAGRVAVDPAPGPRAVVRPLGSPAPPAPREGQERRLRSQRWAGLKPTGRTLKLGDKIVPEPGDPVIVNCKSRETSGLCGYCLLEFARVLTDVPYILDTLDVAISGQVRFVERGAKTGDEGSGANPAVAAHQRIAQALDRVASWYDTRHPEQLAIHVGNTLDLLAADPTAQPTLRALALDLTSAVSRAHKVIDRPADRWFFGPCPDCGQDLPHGDRADPDDTDTLVVCRTSKCGYSAKLIDHRRAQLDAGADLMLTEDELIGVITRADEPVTRKQIRRYVAHAGVVRETVNRPEMSNGRLVEHMADVYRLGDIRSLADGENPELAGTITSRDVAQLLGVTEDAIRKLAERGQLAPLRKGAKPLRFQPSEVDRYRHTRTTA